MSVTAFVMDGIRYNVNVFSLTRKFSVQDTDKATRTQSGGMYRDPIGTFYNYTMVVGIKDGDRESLDLFWDAVSKPEKSHVCTFPYNQRMLTQKMYVTSGEQNIEHLEEGKTLWGDISLNFIAMTPKVVP